VPPWDVRRRDGIAVSIEMIVSGLAELLPGLAS
jgi:hypothetical protein